MSEIEKVEHKPEESARSPIKMALRLPFSIEQLTPIRAYDNEMAIKPIVPMPSLRLVLPFQNFPIQFPLATSSNYTSAIMSPTIPTSYKQRSCIHTHRRSLSHRPYQTEFISKRFDHAVALNNVESVSNYLLNFHSACKVDDGKNLTPPLHVAAGRGYAQLVAELLRHGARPNAVDGNGNTPLHLAVSGQMNRQHKDVISLLLQHGANVMAKDRLGRTPINLIINKLNSMEPEVDTELHDCFKLVLMMMWRCFEKKKKVETDLNAISEGLRKMTTNDQETDKSEADALWAKVQTMSLN